MRHFVLSAAGLLLLAGCNPGGAAAPASESAEAAPVGSAATPNQTEPTTSGGPVEGPAPQRTSPADPDGPAGQRGPGRGMDGPVTLAAMVERSERSFERADTDGNGVIEGAELDAGGRGRRMLSRADGDGDGRVTRAEMRAGAEAMFRMMDANGDGVVDEGERPERGGGRGPR